MTATSTLFTLLGTSILRSSHNFSQLPIKFNRFFVPPSLRFNRYSSSAVIFDSDASSTTTDDPFRVSAHPWPEWVNFVDSLKAKGYLVQNVGVTESGGGGDEGVAIYTEMYSLKDACLSFARDRFDIFKSLSAQEMQKVVGKGCPNLYRKAVNSAKRLRAYLELDEGDVCSSCNLRGSCDRACIMLNDSESTARTVDIVRILLLYALDPLVISGEKKPPGIDLIEASARKLLSELIELGETLPDPELSKPATMTSEKKKQSLDLLDNGSSQNGKIKLRDWVCTKCNFTNFARNVQCRSCGEDASKARGGQSEMKMGDWICPECSFMNFARNTQCLKCKSEGPKSVSVGSSEMKKADWTCPVSEMKKGDWTCPGCTFMNFASNKKCLRCQEPRPQRLLKPGDWECPDCDFLNYSRNNVCKRCNHDRPHEELATLFTENTWKKPY